MRARISPSATTQLDEAHAVLGGLRYPHVRLDFRPVHAYTLSNEVAYIEPKERVY